jgi:hypothetical protein
MSPEFSRETQKRSGTETALTVIEFGEERILPDLDKQSATEAMAMRTECRQNHHRLSNGL